MEEPLTQVPTAHGDAIVNALQEALVLSHLENVVYLAGMVGS